jgi:hypothetical protein
LPAGHEKPPFRIALGFAGRPDHVLQTGQAPKAVRSWFARSIGIRIFMASARSSPVGRRHALTQPRRAIHENHGYWGLRASP